MAFYESIAGMIAFLIVTIIIIVIILVLLWVLATFCPKTYKPIGKALKYFFNQK